MRKPDNDGTVALVEVAIEIVDFHMGWELYEDMVDTVVGSECELEDTYLEAVGHSAAVQGKVVVDMVVERVNASHVEGVVDIADTASRPVVDVEALVNHVPV